MSFYKRTRDQDHFLGIYHEEEVKAAEAAQKAGEGEGQAPSESKDTAAPGIRIGGLTAPKGVGEAARTATRAAAESTQSGYVSKEGQDDLYAMGPDGRTTAARLHFSGSSDRKFVGGSGDGGSADGGSDHWIKKGGNIKESTAQNVATSAVPGRDVWDFLANPNAARGDAEGANVNSEVSTDLCRVC